MKQEERQINDAKRNPKAFEVLYDTHYKTIYLFIYHRIYDKEVTADLTSQVFLKALINIKNYQYKNVPFSAWLMRIASNEVGQYYRKTKKMRCISINDTMIEQIGEEVENSDIENLTNKLLSAIQKLQEDAVKLLEMRFYEQRSFKEIGHILNITENYAKVKTYRVLDKLKSAMKYE